LSQARNPFTFTYDHCTAQFLEQAGVTANDTKLAEVDINGNGHFAMIQKNNLELATFISSWMTAESD